MAQFIALIYGKYFLTTSLTAAAPRNDLDLFYQLTQYRIIDQAIADAALVSFHRHCWYLTQELVPLALCDPALTPNERQQIARALDNEQCPDEFPPHKPDFPIVMLVNGVKPPLSTFVGPNSWLLFHLLDLPTHDVRIVTKIIIRGTQKNAHNSFENQYLKKNLLPMEPRRWCGSIGG